MSTLRVLAVIVLIAAFGAAPTLTSAQAGTPVARAATAGASSSTTSEFPLRIEQFVGSQDGVAWQVDSDVDDQQQAVVYYSTFGGAQNAVAGVIGQESGLVYVQGQVSLQGPQLYLGQTDGPLTGVDITTGATLPARGNCARTATGCFTMGRPDGTHWQYRYTDDATGAYTTFGPVLINGASLPTDLVWVRAVDDDGVVIEGVDGRPGMEAGVLDYLDFATGQYTVLDGTRYSESAVVTLGSDHIVWTHDEHAYYLDRSDLSAAPLPAAPDGAIDQVAINGDTLAYITISPDDDSDGPHTAQIHTGTVGGTSFTTVTDPRPIAGIPMSVDDGDFGVPAGSTVSDYGIYRVVPGQSSLGAPIALFGFAPPHADYPPGDFTATNATTLAVISPTQTWSIQGAADQQFGAPGDVPAVQDNAAGVSEIGVFRPSTGTWFVRQDGVTSKARWGADGDIPAPAHYSGSHSQTVIATFRPTNGRWYIRGSASFRYGTAGDEPVPGAYYGKSTNGFAAQAAVFRPSTGTWYIRGHASIRYGTKGDIPVPGDYDGDGTTDTAVYRPSTGQWYVRGHAPVSYGQSGDIPVIGDFTGDGHIDIAVYRPATGVWWIRGTGAISFGAPSDRPVEAASQALSN